MIGRRTNRGSLRLRAVPAVVQTKPEQNRNISPAIIIAVVAHLALAAGLAAWKFPFLVAAAPRYEPVSATISFAGVREPAVTVGNPKAGGRGSDTRPSVSLLRPPTPRKLEAPPPLALLMPPRPVIGIESKSPAMFASSLPMPSSASLFGTNETGIGENGNGNGHGTGTGVGDGPAPGVVGNGTGFGVANYVRSPQPQYPPVARQQGWEGTTVLRVEIQADGLIGAIQIVQSAGHKVLDDAAIESVRAAQFQPARLNGTPISSWVEVPVTFRLNRS